MFARFNNRLTYLSVSFVLLLAAVPLVSIGTSRGLPALWWLGLGALAVGGLIPPVRRFFNREPRPPE